MSCTDPKKGAIRIAVEMRNPNPSPILSPIPIPSPNPNPNPNLNPNQVEMRIVGDSEVLMAPFFGNRHGTCSIEVLTTENVRREDWLPFCQAILDKRRGDDAAMSQSAYSKLCATLGKKYDQNPIDLARQQRAAAAGLHIPHTFSKITV